MVLATGREGDIEARSSVGGVYESRHLDSGCAAFRPLGVYEARTTYAVVILQNNGGNIFWGLVKSF